MVLRSQIALCDSLLRAVVEEHPDDARDPIDLAHDDAELDARVRRHCIVILESLGAHANHSHGSADLVRESGGQRADRGETISALKIALEFQFATMPLLEVGAGLGELLIELAKFFAEQFHFAAGGAIRIVRGKFCHLRRQIGQRPRDVAIYRRGYDSGDDGNKNERENEGRDRVCAAVSRHLGPVLNFEQVSNDLSGLPFQGDQLAEPVLRVGGGLELGGVVLRELHARRGHQFRREVRERVPERAVLS